MGPQDRLVDADALEEFLTDHLGPADDFAISYHPRGYSNETFFLTWDDRDLVLRRPPAGETAEDAHDVLREYEIYLKLQDTPVPVPGTVAATDDKSVLGAEFYVVEQVEGRTYHDGEPEAIQSVEARRSVSEAFVDVLTSVHELDYAEVSLESFGRPEGFTRRQIDQWTKQLEWATAKTKEIRQVPEITEIRNWLKENRPEQTAHTLVHGDYTLQNVMFAPNTPSKVMAAFDWEMGTLGDPFTDLGWTLASWREPSDPPNPAPEFLPSYTEKEGYFTRDEFVARYEAQTGVTYDDRTFYRVFGFYKLIAVCEMFFARYLDGAENEVYPLMEQYVPQMASMTIDIIGE